jgi:hypothetical protein
VIGHDQQMIPIDFGVKGQGYIDLVGKKFSDQFLKNA